MIRFVRGGALAVVLAFVVLLAACGGDSSPSPAPSPSSQPLLTQLSSLAYVYRSSESPTQAWWVRVPRSEADRLLGGLERSPSASPGADAPTYVVILKGAYTGGDGKPYRWAVVVGRPGSSTAYVTNRRPDTGTQAWTPLFDGVRFGASASTSPTASPSMPAAEFVGTWRSTESNTLVVSKVDGVYGAALYDDKGRETMRVPMNERGADTLAGSSGGPAQGWTLSFDTALSRLVLSDAERGALFLTKVSSSTAAPAAD
jgi:hypothetical protein